MPEWSGPREVHHLAQVVVVLIERLFAHDNVPDTGKGTEYKTLGPRLPECGLEEAELQTLRARRIEFIRAAKDSELSALTPIYGAAALFADHWFARDGHDRRE